MNYQILITTVIILFIIVALYREMFRPVIVFMIATVVLLFTGIIEPKDALAGFANDQIAIIFLLVILSDIIQKTGTLDILLRKVFNQRLGYRRFLARMTSSVAFVSPWVNNTPLVAIMLPYVYDWAKKKNIAPSKVLIPLSYAAIIGGTATLIGTSTNLVVNALAVEAAKTNADIVPLKIFDFSPVGIPLVFVGLLYIIFWGPKLLPSRRDPLADFEEKASDYLTETFVPATSSYIGKPVSASLRNLKSVYMVELLRDGQHLSPVNPDEIIRQGDVLIFAGAKDTILEMISNPRELSLPEFSSVPDHEKTDVLEVVISSNSLLNSKKVRDTGFRGLYDAAILAIKRDGEQLQGSIGEVVLRAGDLLLIIAGNDFKERVKAANDFYVISKVKELRNMDWRKTSLIIISVFSAFIISGFTGLGLFKCLLIPIVIITFMNIIKLEDLKNTIDVDLFLILALALGVGKAIHNSGADDLFAGYIIRLIEPFHSPMAALIGIYILTNVLAMMVTNKAAVAITFPITMALVAKLRMTVDPGMSYTPFILAIAYAGCAEFITPFGYQTNLMVYGPGGYKFKDYVRFGYPLTILFMVTAVAILGYIYHLY